MKTSISRLQIILIIAVCLSAIIMIVSIIFDHSLHIFRYAGYFTQILLGILCLSMSYRETSKSLQINEKVAQYKQPVRRLGIVLILLAVLSFCIFDLHTLLF